MTFDWAAIDWATVITLLVGNGVIVGLITIVFDWHQNNVQRDFEARREAKNYYLPLYGHIAKLDEFVGGYIRSLETGKAKMFEFENYDHSELTSQEILDNFKNCYGEFSKFYIKKKSEGYELFITDKMKEVLMTFWCEAQNFYDNNDELKHSDNVRKFRKLAGDLTDIMEELFGLN